MRDFLKRATFFLGWLLSPLTSWNDAFINIPLAYLIAKPATAFFHTDIVVTLVAAYWLTNIAGVGMMLLSGHAIIKEKRNAAREIAIIITTIAVYSLAIAAIGQSIRYFLKISG
jgi:hypothetical protein